jgi:ABC-type multidrug transport system fused ATPase/permease subunit
MSEGGFHVHGAHDHAVEHAAEHGGKDKFVASIAVTTAILATVGALFSYQGGATQSNAGLYKNNAAIIKTEAANRWAYYQSKSIKQNLAESFAQVVSADKQEKLKADVERYNKEKDDIKKEAEKLDNESKEWDKKSDEQMHQHHRWAQATTFLQIAIALSAIALLTRKSWLQWGVYGVAIFGVGLGIAAAMHY